MEALKLKARIRPDGTVDWPDLPTDLPPGEVDVLVYPVESAPEKSDETEKTSASDWPRLKGGSWKGESLRRAEFYGGEGR